MAKFNIFLFLEKWQLSQNIKYILFYYFKIHTFLLFYRIFKHIVVILNLLIICLLYLNKNILLKQNFKIFLIKLNKKVHDL